MMAGPLSHIRVLDLSRILAAPWAGQILADLGADVIKVERPGAGDDTRSWGPPFLKDRNGAATSEAGYYLAVNRGKRSLTISLDTPDGQSIARSLAARSDIVLENFKVGTLAKFRLGYEDLKAINPKLIYCSVTGFGQSGPRRDQAAYDFMIQAMGGLMSVTGERDDRPGGGAQKVGLPIVDLMTGMYATIAVLAALARRDVSGAGEYIDIGMLDVQVAMLSNQAMNYLVSGEVPKRTGNSHPNIQPQDVFECRDGAIALAVGNDRQFKEFCNVLGLADLATDERFASNAGRVRNMSILRPLITARLKQKERAEWGKAFEARGVPAGPINSIAEVFADPQVKHRQMRLDIPHPLAGTVPQVASPMRFSGSPPEYARPPPLLGEHTVEILRDLGIDDAQIQRLRADRVI
ncbi:MAG: L-carnitine dehydratase/bile acid-inducible protein [Gammaproteobacteria bacterium]|jgi:crotonobetainyl-CoA:carnitine CoA-transferase CaiB-like acyl-CoA transferase|nr:L-carnitine dehydratase/bile acid-inducible protein [Gammaproteobacteria bacterium]